MKRVSLSEFLKNRRKELDLGQEHIANYVGVSVSAVSRWENGFADGMGLDSVKKLSEILKVTPMDIINYYEDEITVSRPLTQIERELIIRQSKLTEIGILKVLNYMDDLLLIDKYVKDSEKVSLDTQIVFDEEFEKIIDEE